MRSIVLVVVGSLAVLLCGCAKKRVAAPPGKTATLDGLTASYRSDWGAVSPCEVDPRAVTGDAKSTAALLSPFLDKTSAAANGMWTPEQLALYEQALQQLPPLLDGTEKLLARSAGCPFSAADGAREALAAVKGLVPLARARLAQAPEALPNIKAGLSIAAWKVALPTAINGAREQWCTPKPKPDIFFAYEDEAGTTEWLFCDGARVLAMPGNKPEFKEPAADPTAKKAKKPDAKKYLESASSYPGSEVQRAPKRPVRSAKPDDGSPEPKDG